MTIDEGRYGDPPALTESEHLQYIHQISKYTGNEAKYVKDFLRNKKTPFTMLFEEAFREKVGARYAIALNSGTSALHVALMASGVGCGDEVILPALCPAMDVFAVIFCGAIPVFADVDPDSFTLDGLEVKREITRATRVVITVGLFGLPTEVFPVHSGVNTIQDNAQNVDILVGDMAIYSFERSKHLPIGEGGMIVTDDEKLAAKVRKLAGLGYANLTAEAGRMTTTPETFQDPDYLRHDTVGYNYRMPEICAAVGLAQVEKMEELVRQRREIAKLYGDALDGCRWLVPQRGNGNSYYAYAVRFMRDDISWRGFYNKFKEFGGDGFYAANMVAYKEPALKGYYGNCPVAEDLQKRLMLFKTNYRCYELAERQADALNKTWRWFDG